MSLGSGSLKETGSFSPDTKAQQVFSRGAPNFPYPEF